MRKVVVIVAAALLIGAIAACGSSGSPSAGANGAAKDAVSYMDKHQADAATVMVHVQTVREDAVKFGHSGNPADLQAFAADAQRAHDVIDSVRNNLAELDGGKLGDAETEVFGAANDLKNDMGAFVAASSDATGTQMAAAVEQFSQHVAAWNDGVSTIWKMAGSSDAAPTV